MQEQAIQTCKQILKKNNLHPLKKLGKGGFSLVFLVEKIQLKQPENELYSVKCINKKQFLKRPSLAKYIQQQISMWRELSHPNIVELIRTFEDEGWIFMIMEYCDRGNLQNVQNTKENGLFTLEDTMKIAKEVIDGLEYMHAKNLIHRDIKAQNVLLVSSKTNKKSNQMTTKICDLGFCREDDDNVSTFCGTTNYMAPEIFEKKTYDFKVDIWSLGVLLFYMLFGEYPFKGLNIQYQIVSKCSKGYNLKNIKVKNNSSISKSDLELLTNLFHHIFKINPNQRVSLQQIKKYKWFNLQKPISRNTTAQSESSQDDTTMQVQKCHFLREIVAEVKASKFLNIYEEVSFKYYINKMILTLLEPSSKSNSSINKYHDQIMMENLQLQKYLNSNLKKITINKFSDFLNLKARSFSEFKEAYRVVVGHIFSKAHKGITQDLAYRSRIKIKLFCCHVINRVFEKEHRNQIFIHYFNWLKKDKKSQKFEFKTFKKWIQNEQPEKLIQTVQIMNDKFYKKTC